MLAIVDYEAGNQTSVRRALEHCGVPCRITAEPEALLAAEGIIFPGVGAAPQAMAALAASGLDAALRRAVQQGRPLLGICLGCQILLERSEEGDSPCLGLVPGVCRRFPAGMREEDGSPAPVPHMGWNRLAPVSGRPGNAGDGGAPVSAGADLLDGIAPGAEFYFVHGYYAEPRADYVLARTRYGLDFCSFYGRPGLWAVQFHPEKSGRPGLRLLENFYRYCRGAGRAEPEATHAL